MFTVNTAKASVHRDAHAEVQIQCVTPYQSLSISKCLIFFLLALALAMRFSGKAWMKNSSELRAAVDRKPFLPFAINLFDGEQLTINADTEVLFPKNKPELVIVFSADGMMHLFEAEAIASLVTT
jgi:hypothetical protein